MTGGAHLPGPDEIGKWPQFGPTEPLRVLVSGCVAGWACGVDGTSYGAPHRHLAWLFERDDVRTFAFCPEDHAFGTPRRTPDIHGGTGADVLDGRARVLADDGEDWTDARIGAARAMLAVARQHDVRLAVPMDISAACGSQVIYLGRRSEGVHQAGQGVAAALLLRHGIKVVSQRDHRTLGLIARKLDPSLPVDPAARDHHQTDWYRANLG